MYLMYHEELESLVKNFPEIKRARFWMTFGEQYLNYLKVIQDIGLSSLNQLIIKYRHYSTNFKKFFQIQDLLVNYQR